MSENSCEEHSSSFNIKLTGLYYIIKIVGFPTKELCPI